MQPSLNKPLLLELIKAEYLEERENILLVGASGTGKTHLATALGIAACGAGRKVRFFRVTELITTLMEARDEKQLLRLRTQLAKQDLLILDELGYVPASKLGAELLFDIISTAYERQTKAYIESQARLHVFYLPSYSPDWNPDEKVWNHLKHHELKSHQAKTKDELKHLTRRKLQSMAKRPELLQGLYFRCCVSDFFG
jgi:transposase